MGTILNPETFLDLVQRAHHECGVQGAVPTDLVNATGINFRLFMWVNGAWKWLQGLYPDWHFMHRTDLSFVTVAGQMSYTPSQAGVSEGAVSSWKKRSFRVYQTSVGQSSELEMTYWPYEEFYPTFMKGALRTSQRPPYNFTIDPSMNIVLECPSAGYTITGEYYRAVTGMDDELDVPTGLDAEDRMVLVYKAMEWYANDENAPEVLATAQKETRRIQNRLEIRRLTKLQD